MRRSDRSLPGRGDVASSLPEQPLEPPEAPGQRRIVVSAALAGR